MSLLTKILAVTTFWLGVVLTIHLTEINETRAVKQPCERKITLTSVLQNQTIAWITFYQPTIKQCGSTRGIGASGTKCYVGTCAVSQKLLDYHVNYFDTLEVLSGVAKGKYVVTDKAASKGHLVDIFKPIDYKGNFCYKSKIKIK